MNFRRKRRFDETVNVTPLIDVLLLLVIFFVVSTTFTDEARLRLQLPEARAEVFRKQKEQIEIVIQRDGGYAVNGKALINKQRETLWSALAKVSNGRRDLPLIITADAQTPYQSVVTAMDVAGQLGFVDLNITTQNPRAGE